MSVVIIHFQPLERFPPVINLLDHLSNVTDERLDIFTTRNRSGSKLQPYKVAKSNVHIHYASAIEGGKIKRLFRYVFFYFNTLIRLFFLKPATVLYFETLSSWPALLYKKIRGSNVRLMVHYHEYTGTEGYPQMLLVKKLHQMEMKMYANNFQWISHTNPVRLEKFRQVHDLVNISDKLFHTVANYPSKQWAAYQTDFGKAEKTRLVFVGSLGYENMYLKETVDWVIKNKESFSLHFYAYNIDAKAKDYLEGLKDPAVKYFGGCDYSNLPEILKNYDVGLVIYKPFSYNTVNAVSNKVFEYLACGLDVWFSVQMTYTLAFVREHTYPKIIAVNFEKLDEFDFEKSLLRKNMDFEPTEFFYENEYRTITQTLLNSNDQ